jgi:hypothetical protein
MQLWDYLPENRLSPLRDDHHRRTPLYVEHRGLFAEPHALVSVPVVYFPPNLVRWHRGLELKEYLQAFPDAQGYHSYVRMSEGQDADPQFSVHADGWGELVMNWMLPGERPASYAERMDFLKTKTQLYDGSLYFFPSSLHPLMAWWAVLFALSMLARYQPAEWAAHINVDGSRHAVQLEGILRRAIDVVPRLIVEAIDQVATQEPHQDRPS